MERLIFAFVVLVCAPFSALAQTEGKISVGGSVTHVITTDDEAASVTGVGFVARLNPKRGWGPAAAFNWFRADIDDPSGAPGDFARLRIRPLMGGIAYTIGPDKVLTSFSIVAGPSFNSFDFRDDFLDRVRAAGLQEPSVDIETSFAIRPGVNVTWTVAPRVAIIGFGGYMYNRPDVVYRDPFGAELRNEWKADAVVFSVGAVYSLF